MEETREVGVALEDMKFSAAHFVAFKGFREPVHGHNYTVGMRVGSSMVQSDGYIVDFGELKKVARKACRELNQRTLIPMRSDVLTIGQSEAGSLNIACEDGAKICIPVKDCALLPIVHSTAEELAEYLFTTILVRDGTINVLLSRAVKWLEVSVSERPGQGARYCRAVTPALAATLLGKSGSDGKAASTIITAASAEAAQAALAHEALAARALAQAGARNVQPRPCLASEDQGEEDQDMASGGSKPAPLASLAGDGPGSDDKTTMPDHILEAEDAFRRLLATLGPSESGRPELERTPYRAAKAFHEMTRGLHWPDPRTAVGKGVFEVKSGSGSRDLVAVRDIPFHSLCEHHLLPFYGVAHVAYFPDGRVLGLSKFARLLEVFSRRLQLQERLTTQFVEALQEVLGPRAIAVALEASHMCMSARGVQSPSRTRTFALRGMGKDDRDLREALVQGVSFSHEHRARL